jgi:hypothetical protein
MSATSSEHNPNVHYKREEIATFDVPVDKVFNYMSAGNHHHKAFKSHRLLGIAGNVVTVQAEIYNPDGTTFTTTIIHELHQPGNIETSMSGGNFDGAHFVHTYTPVGDKTKVDLEGDFPAFPGISEADELQMIDNFFLDTFTEDAVSIRTWGHA